MDFSQEKAAVRIPYYIMVILKGDFMSATYIASLVLIGLGVGFMSSLIGVGGGVFLVPILLWLGLQSSKTVGTSFLIVLIISVSSMLAQSKLHNVDYRLGVIIGLGAIVGTQLGSRVLPLVPHAVFVKFFAVALIIVAILLLLKK